MNDDSCWFLSCGSFLLEVVIIIGVEDEGEVVGGVEEEGEGGGGGGGGGVGDGESEGGGERNVPCTKTIK